MNQANTQQQSASGSVAPSTANTRLSGSWLVIARTLWLVLVVPSLGLFVVGLPAYYAQVQRACVDPTTCNIAFSLTAKGLRVFAALGFSISGYAAFATLFWVIIVMAWSGIGFLIFWRRSDEWFALLVAFALVMFNITYPGLSASALALVYPALTLPITLMGLLGQVSITVFFLLFPNGRLVPRWMGAILPLIIVQAVSLVVPPTLPFSQNSWPGWLNGLLALIIYGTIIFSQIYRYRRVSTPVERQQTKWVAFGISTVATGFLVFGLLFTVVFPMVNQPDNPYYLFTLVYPLQLLLIPVSVGVAILRSRLWDIDLIINRTLVYGLLTACVVGFYVLVVGYLGSVFHTGSNLAISLLATGLIAVLFQSLRGLLQRGVNRLFYGQRDEPYRVISRLGQRLEATLAPDAVLSVIVETVAQALKLPYAAITLKSISATNSVLAGSVQGSPLKQDEEFAIAASYVSKVGGASTRDMLLHRPDSLLHLPLLYQSEQIGELLFAARARGESFTPADRRLLDDLARQVGVAVHAARLTADLQQSRERLVTAREEERRRLRRDLHDGLGPVLASITLKLDATRNLLTRNPSAADALLVDLKKQTQSAVADIRRLVYELRPPSLDELGLIQALREQAEQYLYEGLRITIDAPEPLPPLPAAVEVAAYRIVQEAMTNVVRHAQAHTCTIHFALDHGLDVEMCDDGRGIPAGQRAGVGLTSIRERVAELAGRCEIEAVPAGGTRLHVRLPLPKATEREE
jgi:signal transduction histidine kinase